MFKLIVLASLGLMLSTHLPARRIVADQLTTLSDVIRPDDGRL